MTGRIVPPLLQAFALGDKKGGGWFIDGQIRNAPWGWRMEIQSLTNGGYYRKREADRGTGPPSATNNASAAPADALGRTGAGQSSGSNLLRLPGRVPITPYCR
jgi:hypothetical protein